MLIVTLSVIQLRLPHIQLHGHSDLSCIVATSGMYIVIRLLKQYDIKDSYIYTIQEMIIYVDV